MSKQPSYVYGINNIIIPTVYNARDKDKVIRDHSEYMLSRTQTMFRYEGLPETVPSRMLELYLQTNGHVAITEVKGDLYAIWGNFGGEPDPYYMPTKYTVSNPALNFSKTLDIGVDCVVIPNDPLYKGLMPMFSRYATALCDNEITLFLADINARIQTLISASDDITKKSAEHYLTRIYEGDLSIIAENGFLEGIKTSPFSTNGTNVITNLIEYEQYLRASWFNDLGLNSNYNMKRESINSNESQLNDDMLHPLVDSMLQSREEAIDKVNALFGTNISVSLASAWEDNQKELDAELEQIEEDPETPDVTEEVPDSEEN